MTDTEHPEAASATELAGEALEDAGDGDASEDDPRFKLTLLQLQLSGARRALRELEGQVAAQAVQISELVAHISYMRFLLEPQVAADRRAVEQHKATRSRHEQPVADPLYRDQYAKDTVFGRRDPAVTLTEPDVHPVGVRVSNPSLSGVR